MKKKMVTIILTLCMTLVLLPIKIANAAEESDYNLKEMLSSKNAISYEDLPILFSLSPNQVSDYFPVKNVYPLSAQDYHETVQNGSYSDGTNTWDYSLNVWNYNYGYMDSYGTTHGNDFQITAPAGGTEILHIDMGIMGHQLSLDGGYYPIGLKNIELGEDYASVLKKLGLDTELSKYKYLYIDAFATGETYGIAKLSCEARYSTERSAYIDLYFKETQDDFDSLWIEMSFDEAEKLDFVRYSNGKAYKRWVLGANSEEVPNNIDKEELPLPFENLNTITDISSAVIVVSELANTMTDAQKSLPSNIDLATLYAETAVSKAATKSVASNSILINAAAVFDLEPTAVEASAAVEAALTDGGVTTARYLSKTVILRTEENDITVYVDPDALTTAVDKVRVETPSYALTFKLADLAPDLTQPLIFTAKLPSAKPADSDIGAVQSLSMGDMESQVVTKSILANAAAPAVEIDMPGGKTTNSITVSLPGDGGDTMYQAVVSTDGQATASKYNPVTTTMDGKINASGTYTVKSNEKDFTDIANKSAEMQKAIRYLASRGIISGTTATTFSPDGSINRAEIATLLVKALGKLDSTAAASFSDVTKGNWFYTAAASSQRHKLINGYEDNTFRGTTNISKVQIVSVSSRVLKTEMGYKEPSSPANYLVKYSDTVASWAQPEVALATKENLVVYRTDGTFSGDKAMTRGDAAIIIYRLFQRIW